jgi:hypothetical protein
LGSKWLGPFGATTPNWPDFTTGHLNV